MLPSTATAERNKSSSLPSEQLCRHFSLAEMQLATDNFNDSLVIGHGGFGKVYKSNIQIGAATVAAIKRLDSKSGQGAPEFWTEIEMLSKLRHCHLVSLIGYCNEINEMILVYEYMPNGTLYDHLHKHGSGSGSGTPISWMQRLKICIGAARGLDYLHTGIGAQHGIIHRDVKSSNILLDENWAAKISDFGLSKIGPTNQPRTHVSTNVKGSFGYFDPEYFLTGRLTRKSDVYAFGVVLLEVLCGRRAVDITLDEEQHNLARWAQVCMKEGKLDQIIDSNLRGQISPKCLKEFAKIANRCLNGFLKQRPTMTEVVVGLELALSLQEKFDNPAGATTFSLHKFFLASVGIKSGHDDAKAPRNSENNIGTSSEEDRCDAYEVPPGGQILNQDLKIFSFDELNRATRNFNHEIYLDKDSSYYRIFKGWVNAKTYSPSEFDVGVVVTVKRIDGYKFKKLDLKILEKYNHPNLVNLLGYCLQHGVLFLVHEFMQNGSLQSNLFKKYPAEPLPWLTRLKIAEGTAQGLAFLLTTKEEVTFKPFTTSVILLDRDFHTKLSDSELSKLGLVKEPYSSNFFGRNNINGYFAAAEWCTYFLDFITSMVASPLDYLLKSEVYGFGVVLLETLTGQQVYDWARSEEKRDLVKWAKPLLEDESKIRELIDPQLKNHYNPEAAFQFALLVQKCLQSIPEDRPTVHEVLSTLEVIKAIEEDHDHDYGFSI